MLPSADARILVPPPGIPPERRASSTLASIKCLQMLPVLLVMVEGALVEAVLEDKVVVAVVIHAATVVDVSILDIVRSRSSL